MEFVVLQIGKICFKMPALDALSVGQILANAEQVARGYYPDTAYFSKGVTPETVLIEITADFKKEEPSELPF